MKRKSKPLISVVVPTFNRASSLQRTLESVLTQETEDLFNFEIIAVDNGSTDDTWSVLAAHGDRVRALQEPRSGESYARNTGIAEARGQWVALLDDDEVAEPRWLLALFEMAKKKNAPIVAGLVRLGLSDSMRAALGPICRRVLSETSCDAPHRLLGMELPSTGCVLVERRVFEAIGAFNTDLTLASDSDFFIRARDAEFEMWRTPHSVVIHDIPEHRLSREFFASRIRWQGAYFVVLESKGSKWQALMLGLTRLGSAPLIHLPQLAWCRYRGLEWEALGHELRLHRAWACARAALTVMAPETFPQDEYLAQLRRPPEQREETPGQSLPGKFWQVLDAARRRLRLGFRSHERSHRVEGVEFKFLVASPEAQDWYEKGSGSQEQRQDLAFWKASLLAPGDIVFDCGGFQGFTTVFLAKCVGDRGKVITFELNPQNASIIEQNISLNQLCNAQVERYAVGSGKGTVQFLKRPNSAVVPADNSWFSRLQSAVFGCAQAAQVSLDEYCSETQLWPSMVKIDVEGYEVEVLAGATRLLGRKPRLAIELHPELLARRGQSTADIFELLDQSHYEFWIQWNEDQQPIPYNGSPITHRLQFFALPR